MYRLHGVERDYDWGDDTAIPTILGTPPTGRPVAEYWLGAHADAPASLLPSAGGGAGDLAAAIAADPAGVLGPDCVGRFGARLPFLLKLLAARRPLSIQVHPDAAQARAGYAREEAADIALDAFERTFKDPWHKPEAVYALGPFSALCGFREPAETSEAVAGLVGLAADRADAAALTEWAAVLAAPDPAAALRDGLALLFSGAHDFAGVVDRLAVACRSTAGVPRDSDSATGEATGSPAAVRLLSELQAEFPGDVGVLVALMLNRVELAPGQALNLSAGVPHAYLHGVGVEVMAASDNVVRCGLTHKHVDAGLLRELVDYRPTAPRPIVPDPAGLLPGGVTDFALHVWTGAEHAAESIVGPAIALCTEGSFELCASAGDRRLVLHAGQAALVTAADGDAAVHGSGRLFVAAPGPAGS